MIKINLLGESLSQAGARAAAVEPAALYAETGARKSLPIAGVVVGLLAASIGGVYYLLLNNQIEAKKVQAAQFQKELDELKPFIDLEAKFRKKKEELQNKEQVLVDLRKRMQLPVYFLQELADSLPDDVWFQSIQQNGMAITIQGQARNFESINAFYNNLQQRTRWFKSVVYPGGQKDASGNWVNFTITFQLQNAV
ncbi:MAG TPA: PilN domain-containing protein [Holophagaceae bacterium]|jgi:Tfp pilus assembly protein PilN|nr:PilN domain-containing protein [Holophagaceae bacterium]